MGLFHRQAERKERDQREARELLRLHGADALKLLDRRIEDAQNSRHRSHWQRVKREAERMADAFIERNDDPPQGHPTH